MSPTSSPIKVDVETDKRIADAAHFLGRTKKDIVDAAIREYMETHRDEINDGIKDALSRIDGSRQSVVSALTGLSADRLAELDVVPEN